MRLRTIKVGELGEYISQALRNDQILQNIYVEGELSNLKFHSSGNIYFSIKDEVTKIQCIMFRDAFDGGIFPDNLKDGDQILCRGSINFYKREGSVTIIASSIQSLGESLAYQKFLESKSTLEKEGVFDIANKKALPSFPKKIGIITSITGAVIRDIYHVIKRRYPCVELIVFPAMVQGENAISDIIAGLKTLDNQVDTIILARGGGAYEDLDVFNSIELAYAIFNTNTPIISAVGHETDFTISDLVADVRASTPSVAAEIAVPVLEEVRQKVLGNRKLLNGSINALVTNAENKIIAKRNALELQSPYRKLTNYEHFIKEKAGRIEALFLKILSDKKDALNQKIMRLNSANPNAVFELGGAYLHNMDGRQVDSIKSIGEKMELLVTLKDGQFIVKVTEKI